GLQETRIASQETRMYADVRKDCLMNMIEMDKNIYAAIALALHEFQGNNVHDKESGIITIKPRHTLWNAKFLSMTPKP
ncbi:MAG: hypothetical protein IIT40_05175, partial [Prevotella sp.]|nr:hypothetical protein [Prevotella sp.]